MIGALRPMKYMIEAPTCTVGPSRPIEAPQKRPSIITIILPELTRSETSALRLAGSSIWRAAITCGMPLPCEFGNTVRAEIDGETEAERRDHQRDRRRDRDDPVEDVFGLVGEKRHCDGGAADGEPAEQEDRAADELVHAEPREAEAAEQRAARRRIGGQRTVPGRPWEPSYRGRDRAGQASFAPVVRCHRTNCSPGPPNSRRGRRRCRRSWRRGRSC